MSKAKRSYTTFDGSLLSGAASASSNSAQGGATSALPASTLKPEVLDNYFVKQKHQQLYRRKVKKLLKEREKKFLTSSDEQSEYFTDTDYEDEDLDEELDTQTEISSTGNDAADGTPGGDDEEPEAQVRKAKKPKNKSKKRKQGVRGCYESFQSWIYVTMEQPRGRKSTFGRLVNWFIMILIMLSTLMFILSTDPIIGDLDWFEICTFSFEQVCLMIFLIEYFLRLFSITAPESKYYYRLGPVLGRLRYLISFSAIIDLIAIVPSVVYFVYFVFVVNRISQHQQAEFVREFIALRVLRMLRLLKAERYFRAVNLIKNVLKRKQREFMTAAFIMIVTVLLVGSLIYYVEKDAQPADFGTIPLGIYWAAVAMSTGNIGSVPMTLLGRIINVGTGAIAIAFVALPTSILGYGFVEELDARKEAEEAAKAELAAELQEQQKLLEEANKKKAEEEEAAQKSMKQKRGSTVTNLLDFGGSKEELEEDGSTLRELFKDSLIFECPHCKTKSPIKLKLQASL